MKGNDRAKLGSRPYCNRKEMEMPMPINREKPAFWPAFDPLAMDSYCRGPFRQELLQACLDGDTEGSDRTSWPLVGDNQFLPIHPLDSTAYRQ